MTLQLPQPTDYLTNGISDYLTISLSGHLTGWRVNNNYASFSLNIRETELNEITNFPW